MLFFHDLNLFQKKTRSLYSSYCCFMLSGHILNALSSLVLQSSKRQKLNFLSFLGIKTVNRSIFLTVYVYLIFGYKKHEDLT